MKYIYIIISICFLNYPLNGKESGITVPHDKTTKVQFELVDGLILLPLTVNGVKGTYILDTGAPCLTLNKRVEESEFTLITHNRSHIGKSISVEDVRYGQVLKEGVEAWVMDLSFIERMIDRPIAGILGADLLQGFDVLIDFESKEIQLLTSEVRKLSLESRSYNISVLDIGGYHNQRPIVNVAISGTSRNMIFDTGAAVSVLDNASSTLNSGRMSKVVKINNIRVDDMPFVSGDITPLTEGSDLLIDGILSVSSLNTSKVLLSYSSSRVFLFWPKSSS